MENVIVTDRKFYWENFGECTVGKRLSCGSLGHSF